MVGKIVQFAWLLLMVGALVVSSSLQAQENSGESREGTVYVALLAGQSNAAGWGYHQYLVETNNSLAKANENIDFYYDYSKKQPKLDPGTWLPLQSGSGVPKYKPRGLYPKLDQEPIDRFGPELAMGQALEQRLPSDQDQLAMIKFALGGSNLFAHWRPDGTDHRKNDGRLYKKFQSVIVAAKKSLKQRYPDRPIKYIGLAWVQGESDAIALKGNQYDSLLKTFVRDVRATLKQPQLPVVVAQISPQQVTSKLNAERQANWPLVRAAQAKVAVEDPRIVAVDTSDERFQTTQKTSEGPLHYDSATLLILGEELGNALAELNAWPQAKE